MKNALVCLSLMAASAVGHAFAEDTAIAPGDRTIVWTVAALATDATPAPDSTYSLEWQKQLLLFQLEYASSLIAPTDPMHTGAINPTR